MPENLLVYVLALVSMPDVAISPQLVSMS